MKCGRRGAVRAADANRGLRFLGFARNDRGALWWNDRGALGGMTLSAMPGGRPGGRWRVTRRGFFAALKNDRGEGESTVTWMR